MFVVKGEHGFLSDYVENFNGSFGTLYEWASIIERAMKFEVGTDAETIASKVGGNVIDLSQHISRVEEPLLKIMLDDVDSVPTVLYKGEEIGGKIVADFSWRTSDESNKGRCSYKLEFYEGTSQHMKVESSRTTVEDDSNLKYEPIFREATINRDRFFNLKVAMAKKLAQDMGVTYSVDLIKDTFQYACYDEQVLNEFTDRLVNGIGKYV